MSNEVSNDGPAPVLDSDTKQPEDDRRAVGGTAMCLSGGGYRAMLFHVGALVRLNEMGKLQELDRISSVSGGSITAGVLGKNWKQLSFDGDGVATNLASLLIDPIRAMARVTIDKPSILSGMLRPGRTVTQQVVRAYDRHLFHGASMQSLPNDEEGPRFVINATSVQTGKLFRFSRPYQGDYTIGLWKDPTTSIADAVTASSAFPPYLSPHVIKPSGRWDSSTVDEAPSEPLRKAHWLTDGGVYDNLGLETAWHRHRTLLISDGGGFLHIDAAPKRNWAQHGIRVAGIVDGQVRALRKRELIQGFQAGMRTGTYWGERSSIEDYGLDDPLTYKMQGTVVPSKVPTRLAALDEATQIDVINWGYVIADTALRTWVFPDQPKPSGLPLG